MDYFNENEKKLTNGSLPTILMTSATSATSPDATLTGGMLPDPTESSTMCSNLVSFIE
jgi:hypothetical protein